MALKVGRWLLLLEERSGRRRHISKHSQAKKEFGRIFLLNKKLLRGGKDNEKSRITSIGVGDFGWLGG